MLILAKFAKDKPAVLGGLIVLIVVAIAILAPLLAPYPGDVSASHLLKRLKPPSWDHPFGTDNLGRDILSRVILGARGALTIALMVVGISMAIGVPLGLMAGYSHGWVSEAIMRVTDVFLAVPQLILALALAQLMGPSLQSAMLALTLTYWPFFTRIVYAETRRLSASLFIDALECIGAGARAFCLATSCPTPSRPLSCAPPSAWALRFLWRRCLAFSAWEPRRPIPIGASPLPRAGSTCRRPGGSRPSRALPSFSPCLALIFWAMACATLSTRA